MNVNQTLQQAMGKDDLESIQTSLSSVPHDQAQKELDAALALAMPTGSLSTIGHLLQLGAKLNRGSWITLFPRAEIAIFQLLLDAGWDVNSSPYRLSSLYFALDNPPLLTYLLTHGADPNFMPTRTPGACSHPIPPAAAAAELSDATALRILLAHGATLDPTLLFHAIGLRQNLNGTATMDVLIDAGADVTFISRRWSTPLCGAVRIGDEAKVRYLMARGARPEYPGAEAHLSAVEYGRMTGRLGLVGVMEGGGGEGAP